MDLNSFLYIFFGIFLLALLWFLITKRFRNPHKLCMIFGKKGSGKTSTLVKLAFRYQKKGWTVYSTVPVPGCYTVEPKQIGNVFLKPHSVVLVDEVSLVWSNRDFKNFSKNVEHFFRYQRHDKLRVYLFSQTFDIDKKIRDLTDEMYLMTNFATFWSYGKKIDKKTVLTLAESDRPSTIAENLVFESLFLFWAGSRFLTFIPKYAPFFDSFDNDFMLPEVYLPYEEYPAAYLGSRAGYSRFLVSCFCQGRR